MGFALWGVAMALAGAPLSGRGVGGRHGGLVVVRRAVGQCAGPPLPWPSRCWAPWALRGSRRSWPDAFWGSVGLRPRRRFRPARRCSCLAARPARGSSVGSDSIPLPEWDVAGTLPNEFWLSLFPGNRRERVRCGPCRSERLVHGRQLGRCGRGVQRVLPARHQDVRRPGSRGGLRAPAGGCLRGRLDHHERDPVGARPAALDDGCAGLSAERRGSRHRRHHRGSHRHPRPRPLGRGMSCGLGGRSAAEAATPGASPLGDRASRLHAGRGRHAPPGTLRPARSARHAPPPEPSRLARRHFSRSHTFAEQGLEAHAARRGTRAAGRSRAWRRARSRRRSARPPRSVRPAMTAAIRHDAYRSPVPCSM